MKKILAILLTAIMIFCGCLVSFAISDTNYGAEYTSIQSTAELDLDVRGAFLMEAKSGTVLYAQDEFAAASPASVTKIMTLLLVCEALQAGSFSLSDTVTVSSYAASMGGSQVFLEEGERMSVEDLIKCTVIASANDAAVALAELVSGSESAFVRKMNERAKSLGLKNTSFENTTGLDDTTERHYSCPADIAAMSRELISHDIILKYSSIWQDTIRNGEFTLTNTNRLVRYYEGCNGLKTGSTDKAGYCISTTAKRGNMQLIAVIMGADTRDARNNAARTLLDYGFANFALYETAEEYLEDCTVLRGTSDSVALRSTPFCAVIPRSAINSVEKLYDIPECISAPISAGDTVGKITYMLGEKVIGESGIFVEEDVFRIDFWQIFLRILRRATLG